MEYKKPKIHTDENIHEEMAKLLEKASSTDQFDPMMKDGDAMSLYTLKLCYRKHVKNDQSIGWNELTNKIHNALNHLMGSDQFLDWTDNLED